MQRGNTKTLLTKILVAVACIIVLSMVLYNHNKDRILNGFQNQLRTQLLKIQRITDEILGNKDKRKILILALEYERTGETISAFTTAELFESYSLGGEWANVADILIGESPLDLFHLREGSLSDAEEEFLKALYRRNDQLLKEISADNSYLKNKTISAERLEKTLNNYFIELQEYIWK